MLNGKRVLITGSTGFIGANLTKRCLKEGANVYIFYRKTSNKWRIIDNLQDINQYCVDLLDYESLESSILQIKPEIIFHTAVYGGYFFQKDMNMMIQTNIIGTANLVNACLKSGFNILVNTGSSSEYGLKNNSMEETDVLEPNNIYGVSKASASLFCQMKVKAENSPIVTLRLFSPFGYYEEITRLVPSVIISCLKGRNPKLSSPTPVRDFIFIEDVIDSYIKAVENKDKIRGEIFNIGYGKQYSVKKVVNKIIKLTGNKVRPEWGSVSNPRIEPKFWQADISKAKDTLNWRPRYNLEEGLNRTIEWFKENMRLYEGIIGQ